MNLHGGAAVVIVHCSERIVRQLHEGCIVHMQFDVTYIAPVEVYPVITAALLAAAIQIAVH